ncbi:MAG: (deoxy)nucleoside triphosphate pyrophosphohydrolase [Clostridia bacterium]|nr:(deoxy)nucleoside triphosphate pyrophosphohydrolase [Clostridia bacterium]
MKSIKVVAAIIYDGEKYLCTERDIGKFAYSSYKWEFPGGKIEMGESNENALKREIKEELGIDITIENYFCGINYVYPDFELTMYVYECKPLSLDVQLNVHKSFKWLSLNELNTVDWASADKLVVNKLITEKSKVKKV